MQPPPTVPFVSPFWKKTIFAPRCCGVDPRVWATVATTTRSPRSPASLIMRYRSRCGIVGIWVVRCVLPFGEIVYVSPYEENKFRCRNRVHRVAVVAGRSVGVCVLLHSRPLSQRRDGIGRVSAQSAQTDALRSNG